jgi:phospho-N-acetylmuramoyl-pentapeptide-transferase
MEINIVKVFVALSLSFAVGIGVTPFLTHFLYKYKMWKRQARTSAIDGSKATLFHELHKEREVGTPRMGGIVVWASVLLVAVVIWSLARLFPADVTAKLDFLSRNQTWLLLFTLIASAFVGLIDDILQIYGKGAYIAGGLSLKKRIALVALIGMVGALWFFFKLEVSSIAIPFMGKFELGWFFIPFFVIVMIALFSGSVIDGIDGLSGGVMTAMFSAYSGIAFFQNQIDTAAFCAAIVGGLLAFLWFNIPPARFYMGETGILALTTTLGVVAFLTDNVPVLLIIAFPLFATSGSVIIQLLSKRFFHRKVFLIAPIHHHFEALGWPSQKVTMRFWIFSFVLAIVGVTIALIGK